MASSLHEAASSVATMSDGDAVETSSTCSMEETCAKIENALRRNLKLRDMDNDSKEDEAPPIITDPTKLPGYTPIPENAPQWKIAMIEKKNEQLLDDALRKHDVVRQEEEKWKDVPEWKKALMIEREKRREEENAPFEHERRARTEEMAKLQQLPEWKRNLILKKRGDM
ncbi:hypothetical protein CAPTEDRAFT_224651 [Capitella teleta]|uniref:Uncharacterized protein n=1 Tax=Capitella teleta TaxID=283909 RepID=R7U7Y3_CAPTE|nr:hypothetical protein CAPTEDRAFT_224651 [Capitella teleta]|eukprot:ELU02089.1 hypothetical protein CAPTEDRAFT_224651 [Capitella teleta]